MKAARGFALLALLLAGCAFSRPLVSPKTPIEEAKKQIQLKGSAALMGGGSKVDITPAVGTPLAGYAKRRGKPSTGIRDPLYTRVLALSDGDDTVLLISSDLLVFPQPLAQRIVQDLSTRFKLPQASIFLIATHTHSGAGSIGHGFLDEQVFGPYRADVVEGIVARIRWAAQQALEHREPIRFGFGQTQVLDLIENRMVAGGWVDPTVSVFLIESAQGSPIGILVNGGARPAVLDPRDLRMSADYPGALTSLLEKHYPGAVCLFADGAAEDVVLKGILGTSADQRIERFSGAWAEASEGLINQMDLHREGDLAAWGLWSSLPSPQLRFGWLPIHPAVGRLLRPSLAYLNLCALGKAVFVSLPAELTAELGLDLRKKLAAQNLTPFLLGYTNGYLGYALTPDQYRMNSYESWMSWYGPAFGPAFIEELRLLAGLYSQKSGQST